VLELSDVRFALRMWARHVTLIVVASLSLGLGVGATTTMYTLLSGVAHYDLGFARQDRLVVLWNTDVEQLSGQNAVLSTKLAPGEAMRLARQVGDYSRPTARSDARHLR
jgi:hypothetical protein